LDVAAEASIAEKMVVGIEQAQKLGEQSLFTCPDCGGTLFKMGNGTDNRFRCFTGHVYNEHELLLQQSHNIESTIWVAVRMMEERKNLYTKISKGHLNKGHSMLGKSYQQSADDLTKHIETLKGILISVHKKSLEK
jgi:two-component system, chemotaxis family, protein-glutamate methylesterase/glutaminase